MFSGPSRLSTASISTGFCAISMPISSINKVWFGSASARVSPPDFLVVLCGRRRLLLKKFSGERKNRPFDIVLDLLG